MNGRAVAAIVRRDLTVASANRQVVLPMIFVPMFVLVGLPLTVSLLAVNSEIRKQEFGQFAALLEHLPASVRSGLPEDPPVLLGILLVTYALAPLYLIVAPMVTAVLAADSIAGERERGTLEGVLLTPVSDRELLAAKLLGAWLPALAVGFAGAFCYAVVVDLVFWPVLGRLLLPSLEWILLVVWMGPAVSAVMLGLSVLVSARARSFQGASQVSALVVVPLMVLIFGQATGVLLLGPLLMLGAGACFWLLAALLIALGGRGVRRTRLGERLG